MPANDSATQVYLELKKYQLHTSPEEQAKRLGDWLHEKQMPALAQAGAKLVGAFTNYIGADSPFLLTVTQYDTLAAMETVTNKMSTDAGYLSSLTTTMGKAGYPYQRMEGTLLKTFAGMPRPLLSADTDTASPRTFELRRYESPSEETLRRKVKMFNEGEIGIFQRLGMRPVFFGETVVGERMPNLFYMLSYESLAAREELWKKFIGDPEWKKISSPAEVHDSEIVSNISNGILKPLRFSPIR